MKSFITLLFASIALLFAHTQVNACDLDPTAEIDLNSSSDGIFYHGETIILDGQSSAANCGYITEYTWYIDWGFYNQTVSTSVDYFPDSSLNQGQDSSHLDIILRVKNSVGNYDYASITISIVRKPSSYYYLRDHLGSVRVTVDTSGTAVGWDDYYPFGLQMTGRTQNSNNPDEDIKFTGYELEQQCETDSSGGCINDVTLGLYHAEARMYDPVIGRFNSIDPLASEFPGWSPYTYVFNNPTFYTDPTGMSPVCEEEQNCDDSYTEGAIVENRLGSWRYLGDNQWETLSLADNVQELTSTFEAVSDWLTNGLVNDYYYFGKRTLAENSLNISTTSLLDNPGTWLVGGGLAFAGKILKAFNGSSYLWKVGSYKNLRGLEAGLDAHHVGQRALMKKFVPGYNSRSAPSILVPRAGHTRGTGVVSRNTVGLTNAREVLARDIFELRRVYGVRGIPNSSLKQLIQMNKKMYPEAFIKKN